MNPTDRELHPDLRAFIGLFDHPFPQAMLDNVGRWVRFTEPDCTSRRVDWFQIVGCQKNWRGDDVYRVVGSTDDQFGCPASPDDIVFVDAPTDAERASVAQIYAQIAEEYRAEEVIRLQRLADRRASRLVQPKRRKVR